MIAPLLAKRTFGMSVTTQVLIGMSHLGIILGVIGSYVTNKVKTPIPWLRFAAIILLLIWAIVLYNPPTDLLGDAFFLGLFFTPLSFGWSAGDQALTRYIEKTASGKKIEDDICLLGAITSFLYAGYLVIFVVLSIVLGRFIDSVDTKTSLVDIGGIQFSVVAAFLLLNTLIPEGALSLKPHRLSSADSSKKRKPGYNSLSTNTSEVTIELGVI